MEIKICQYCGHEIPAIAKTSLFLLLLTVLVSSCNSAQKKQQNWIENNLANFIWIDITAEALDTRNESLVKTLADMADQAVEDYSDNGDSEDIDNWMTAELLGLSDLYYLSGGSTNAEKKRAKEIDRYTDHAINTIQKLSEYITDYYSYADSTHLSVRDMISDQAIFDRIIGEPEIIPDIDDNDIAEVALWVAIHTFQGLKQPSISSCEYKKETDIWYVRMDNAENQYVKFYSRNDGEYDIEYSSKLDDAGNPDTNEKYTTSTFSKQSIPLQVLNSKISFNALNNPTMEMLNGSWYSRNPYNGVAKIVFTNKESLIGYDVAKLESEGQTGYKSWAAKIEDGIAYSSDSLDVDINEGVIHLRDSYEGYIYHSLYLDKSEKILLDKDDMTTLYYMVK